MYKLLSLAAVLVALALAPVLTGIHQAENPQGSVRVGEQSSERAKAGESSASVEEQSCDWTCQACEPDQGCRQFCTEIGDCGSSCGVTAQCDAQHVWDDEDCACVSR
jgi:hypothetical protein